MLSVKRVVKVVYIYNLLCKISVYPLIYLIKSIQNVHKPF